MPGSTSKKRRGQVARVALALGVIAFLLARLDTASVAEQIRGIDLRWLSLAFLIVLAESLTKARNWQQLLAGLRVPGAESFRSVACCYFAGGFLGSIVPSTAGTDAIRTMLAANRFGASAAPLAASVVTLNVVSLCSACAIGLTGVALLLPGGRAVPLLQGAALVFAGAIVVGIGAYRLLHSRRDWLVAALRRVPRRWFRLRKPLRRFLDALLVTERAHVRLRRIVAVAIGAQLLRVAYFAVIAIAVGIVEPVQLWMLLAPLVSLAGLVPASIAGFGGDQAAVVYALTPFGVHQAQAFVLSASSALLNLAVHVFVGASALTFCGARPVPAARPLADEEPVV